MVNNTVTVFSDVTPCTLVDRCQCFEHTSPSQQNIHEGEAVESPTTLEPIYPIKSHPSRPYSKYLWSILRTEKSPAFSPQLRSTVQESNRYTSILDTTHTYWES